MFRSTLFAMLIALMLSPVALGQRRDKLELGDKAPGLDIEKWVNGEDISIEPGKVYVIEFWATWCKPCRKTIPHLNQLHKIYQYEGLQVIGISSEKEVSKVERFVRRMGDQMSYNIAVDRRDSTQRAWMQNAGLNGIPAAFIVGNKGKVQWFGNPHPQADQEEFDRILQLCLDGRYDAKLMKKAKPLLDAVERHRKVKNWRMAFQRLDDVIELDPQVFALEHFTKYEMMAVDMGEPQRADEYAHQLLNQYSDDASFLAQFAEFIATNPKISDRDRNLDTALELARAAKKAYGEGEPEGYAIVALVHRQRGEHRKAVQQQTQAYFKAHPHFKPKYKRDLDNYTELAKQG